MNLYAYTGNSPTNYTDSSGTSICLACLLGGGNRLTGRKPPQTGQGDPPWLAYVPPWVPKRIFDTFKAKNPISPYGNLGWDPPKIPETPNPVNDAPNVVPDLEDPRYVPQLDTAAKKIGYVVIKLVALAGNLKISIILAVQPPCGGTSLVQGAQPCG